MSVTQFHRLDTQPSPVVGKQDAGLWPSRSLFGVVSNITFLELNLECNQRHHGNVRQFFLAILRTGQIEEYDLIFGYT
jgi:hypothetical protein